MKLSAKSHRKIEAFFRELLEDEKFDLPEIEFYGGKFTRFFTSKLKIEGITIGRRIFIFPKNFWRSKTDKLRLDEALVVHEITHVLQYRREGFFRFLGKYLRDYWRNLRKLKKYDSVSRSMAYFEIPFEREAREMERKYREWKDLRFKI
jgi:hypothetical protein